MLSLCYCLLAFVASRACKANGKVGFWSFLLLHRQHQKLLECRDDEARWVYASWWCSATHTKAAKYWSKSWKIARRFFFEMHFHDLPASLSAGIVVYSLMPTRSGEVLLLEVKSWFFSTLIVVVVCWDDAEVSLSPVFFSSTKDGLGRGLGVVIGIRRETEDSSSSMIGSKVDWVVLATDTSWATKMGFRGDGLEGTRLVGLSSIKEGSLSMDSMLSSDVHKEPADPCRNQGGDFFVVVEPPDKWPNRDEQA